MSGRGFENTAQDRWRVAGAALAALALAGAALPLDQAVVRWVEATGLSRPALGWLIVSDLGLGAAVLLPLALLLWPDEDGRAAASGLLAVAFAAAATNALKVWIGRARPLGTPHAFPSGHTAEVVAAAFVLARRFPRCRWLFVGGAAMVAAARVLSLQHYPADCLGGVAVGLVGGLVGVELGTAGPVRRLLSWITNSARRRAP